MLLFLVACNASEDVRERAPEALRRAAGFVANLDLDDLTSCTSPSRRTLVLALGHPQSVATPRRYLAERPGRDLVLFDGLPLYPDGGLVLDAERLRERWEDARRLEGPGAALRADLVRDEVELVTGPLGLLPVFACDSPSGGRLLSNSVLVLRLLAGLEEPDPLGVSSLLALGWTVGDSTLTAGIRALPGGSRITASADGLAIEQRVGPATLASRNGGAPDARVLAEQLVESARGLSVLGRVECPLTAGRDSRLCLAVLRAAGVEASYYTLTSTGGADVQVASDIAAAWGLPHSVDASDALWRADAHDLARGFVFQNDGLTTFEQIADHPSQLLPVHALGAKVSGIGGEMARAGVAPIMGPAAATHPLSDLHRLQRRLLALKAHAPRGAVRPEAVARTRTYLRAFVDARQEEGWPPSATGQTFYAFERMGRWGATGVRRTAATADLFSLLLGRVPHRRLLAERWRLGPRAAAPPADERARAGPARRPVRRSLAAATTAAGRRLRGRRQRPGGDGPAAELRPGGAGLRPDTVGTTACDWVARHAPMHLDVVERAAGTSIEEYIDLAALRRLLSDGQPPDDLSAARAERRLVVPRPRLGGHAVERALVLERRVGVDARALQALALTDLLALGADRDHVPRQAHLLHPRISQPDRSISYQRRPWKAERGKAWWLWCQDSPSEGRASQKTLVEWSSVSKRRRPKKWQTELMLQVTWWSRKMRTRPPQSSAVRAAGELPLSAKPSANGIARPSRTSQGNERLIRRMPGPRAGRARSGASGRALRDGQPAHVRVPEALQRAAAARRRGRGGRVRVALVVGERVVLAVVGHPVDHRALHGHRAEHGEAVADGGPPRRRRGGCRGGGSRP